MDNLETRTSRSDDVQTTHDESSAKNEGMAMTAFLFDGIKSEKLYPRNYLVSYDGISVDTQRADAGKIAEILAPDYLGRIYGAINFSETEVEGEIRFLTSRGVSGSLRHITYTAPGRAQTTEVIFGGEGLTTDHGHKISSLAVYRPDEESTNQKTDIFVYYKDVTPTERPQI